MKGGNADKPEDAVDYGQLRADEMASNERARTLSWFCGEAKFGVFWLSEPFDQYTVQAKTKAGKK